jgi:single-strand DNA-binding protein
MAGSVNKVIIIGNLGQDPEIRTTANGQMVATLSIATSESFNGRDGNRQERTEWHRVVVWAKLAELAQRYLSKGRKVFIEGRIQTRSWDDTQSGQKRYSTEIVARDMVFLDSTQGGNQGGGSFGGGNPGGGGGNPGGGNPGGGNPGGGNPGGGGGNPGGGFGGGQGASNFGGDQGGASNFGGASNAPKPDAGKKDPGYFDDDDIPF